MKFGSTCRSIRPGLSNRTAKDRLRFKRRSLTYSAKSNAYIANTLDKFFFLPRILHVSYFCHAYILDKMAGRAGRFVFLLLR